MEVLVVVRVLGDQGSLAQDRNVFLEAFLACELLNLGEELVLGDAAEGVLDPVVSVLVGGLPGAKMAVMTYLASTLAFRSGMASDGLRPFSA